MKKFEVKIVVTCMPGGIFGSYGRATAVADPLSSSFSKLGIEGWELVSVVPYKGVLQHYFKREVLR